MTIIISLLFKRHCMARPVSENDVLDLEVGEKSRLYTKCKQSQAKPKRFPGTLENRTESRNSL